MSEIWPKLGILDSVEQWKLIRELRNAVNHEYEENNERLSEFFQELAQASSTLNLWLARIVKFCDLTYPTPATTAWLAIKNEAK